LETIDKINPVNNTSKIISEYIANVSIMNKSTAKEYHTRLDIFKRFIEAKYFLSVNDIISKIKKNGDPYSLLTEYTRYLGGAQYFSIHTETKSCDSEKLPRVSRYRY
jgi:hypothetical protein